MIELMLWSRALEELRLDCYLSGCRFDSCRPSHSKSMASTFSILLCQIDDVPSVSMTRAALRSLLSDVHDNAEQGRAFQFEDWPADDQEIKYEKKFHKGLLSASQTDPRTPGA